MISGFFIFNSFSKCKGGENVLTRNQILHIIYDKGIKKSKIAKEAGVSRQCLYQWFNGKWELGAEKQDKIEKYIRTNYKIDC